MLFFAALVFSPKVMWAQEPTEEEYKSLTDIQAEKDINKKADLIFTFLKEKPKTAYRPNVMAEYQKVVIELKNDKKWAQIINLGDKMIDLAPNDDFTEAALTQAFHETGNWKGFATYGEKAYPQKPSAALALEIAQAYQKIGNDAKYMQWREKVLAQDPNNIEILIDMTQKYQASQNKAQALKYAKMCLSALPTAKKPEGTTEQAWKTKTDAGYAVAYGVIGANAYENNKYAEAITNLSNAVRYWKRMDMAYYYMGMSYWQQNKLQPAMLNFAKAYIIKGATAGAAKKYLDQLWASSHRNSLAGVQAVIDKAQLELK
jgi:tetratricopeptide (TPR) repeat protein